MVLMNVSLVFSDAMHTYMWGRHAAEWGFVTGDTVLMHLCTDDRGLGVLSFYLNGERVPGCIEGLPMEAIGCQGLTPCVSIATVGDAVRLYKVMPNPQTLQP